MADTTTNVARSAPTTQTNTAQRDAPTSGQIDFAGVKKALDAMKKTEENIEKKVKQLQEQYPNADFMGNLSDVDAMSFIKNIKSS